MVWGARFLSFGKLAKMANRLADTIAKKGAKPGSIIGLMTERSGEMIIGIIGILKTGGAYLPINPQNPKKRIGYMLKNSGAALLLTTRILNEQVEAAGELQIKTHFLGEDDSFKETGAQNFGYGQGANDPAYVIYTSGSSGNPKGVSIAHGAISPLLFWGYEYLGLNERDRVVQNLSYFFDWSVWEIFITLTSGSSLVMAPGEVVLEPIRYVRFMAEKNITALHITPTHFQYVLNAKQKLHTLKHLAIGAEKLTYETVKNAIACLNADCRIYNMYGPTEATIISAAFEIDRSNYNKRRELTAIPIGRASANLKLHIFDRYLNMCPVNIPGELYISGDGLAGGYLNNPELTSSKFIYSERLDYKGVRFYRTGDRARRTADGAVEFLGRVDQQVKIRGFRIETGEVVNRLLTIPYIEDCVVIDREKGGEKYLCAYVVSAEEVVFSKIREILADVLPEYLIPAYIIQIEKIPLTPNGKLDRQALPAPGSATLSILSKGGEQAPPRNKVEEKLARIWSKILELDAGNVGVYSDFFELGGHSLKANKLSAEIYRDFNMKVPLKTIFEKPTVSALAGYIGKKINGSATRYISIKAIEKQEYYDLSSAQRRMYFVQQLDPAAVNYNQFMKREFNITLDKQRLEDTFKKLLNRHESLRTSFEEKDGKQVQIVHSKVDFSIKYWEFAGLNPMINRQIKKISREFVTPFDLSSAPLIRVGLIHAGKEKSILLTNMHHIICDGMSMIVLISDFMSLYEGGRLPGLRLHYKDFAEWKNSKEQLESIKKQEEYWLKEFPEEPPALDLPLDYKRPLTRESGRSRKINFRIADREAKALRKLAETQGVTLYMLLLAIYNVFLSKISGQKQVVIGTDVSGRSHGDLDKIVGMFINMLPLRNFPGRETTFDFFLREVKVNTLQAFENQDYQLADLVARIVKKRDSSRSLLFDVTLSLVNYPLDTDISHGEIMSRYDLSFLAFDPGETLDFLVEYRSSLFKESTIKKFFEYFSGIITIVLKNVDIPLKDIPGFYDIYERKLKIPENNTGFDFK
jgi:amino acid adenylation domain-containing protein